MKFTNPYEKITDSGQAYRDVRPHYPEQLIDTLQIDEATRVVDIGAGTGKLTQQLWRRTPEVWAVEPAAEMIAGFLQVLPDFPRTQLIQATAEETSLPKAAFAVATFAQCWHWLAAPTASREAARILAKNGKIAIFFNQLDVSVPWVLQLSRIMRSGDVQRVTHPPQLTRDFTKPQLQLANWCDQLTVAEICRLGTTRASWIKSSQENRERMQKNLVWYLTEELGYAADTRIPVPYQTQLWTAEKKA